MLTILCNATWNKCVKCHYNRIIWRASTWPACKSVRPWFWKCRSSEFHWFICSNLYFSKNLISVTMEREIKDCDFKTYDMQMHIQIIYCPLVSCCPVFLLPLVWWTIWLINMCVRWHWNYCVHWTLWCDQGLVYRELW